MEKKIEAYGVKGMKSEPWRKVFQSQRVFDKWLEKNKGNVEVYGTREAEDRLVSYEEKVRNDLAPIMATLDGEDAAYLDGLLRKLGR